MNLVKETQEKHQNWILNWICFHIINNQSSSKVQMPAGDLRPLVAPSASCWVISVLNGSRGPWWRKLWPTSPFSSFSPCLGSLPFGWVCTWGTRADVTPGTTRWLHSWATVNWSGPGKHVTLTQQDIIVSVASFHHLSSNVHYPACRLNNPTCV